MHRLPQVVICGLLLLAFPPPCSYRSRVAPETVMFREMETIMRQANVTTLRVLAVILFVAGAVLIGDPSWSLGSILAATVMSCTRLVIDEIREAKRELMGKLAEQKRTL